MQRRWKMKRSKKKFKFTEEELSKILSHSYELQAGGEDRAYMFCDAIGCLFQCALNIPTVSGVFDFLHKKNINTDLVFEWDGFHGMHICKYGTVPGPDALLRFLEMQGVA